MEYLVMINLRVLKLSAVEKFKVTIFGTSNTSQFENENIL